MEEKIERQEIAITSNACTAFNLNEIKNSKSYPLKWSNSLNNSIFSSNEEKRTNNLILFGVEQTKLESSEEWEALDKKSVIHIFNALGISVTA